MASRTHRPSQRAANGHRTSSRTLSPATNGGASSAASPALPPNGARSDPSHDKYAEIFLAAIHLFQEKGYHGASMQDLADAVGMQKASLYYYIQSKQELLTLACERGTEAFTQELVEIVALDETAANKLRLALESYLVALCEQLELFTVFLHEQKFLGDAPKSRLRAKGKQHADLLGQILEQGIAAGEFRPVNVTVTTLAILGMCNWLYEWYSPDGPLQPREIATLFSELILKGLIPDPVRTTRSKPTQVKILKGKHRLA